MRRLAARLTEPLEIALVLTVTFGFFIASSLVAVASGSFQHTMSEAHFVRLLSIEVVLGCLGLLILHARGWNLERLGVSFPPRALFEGLGLLVAAWLMYVMVAVLAGMLLRLDGRGATPVLLGRDVQPFTAVAVSVLNPVYEELFVLGYLVTAIQRNRSDTFAINVSIAIRLAYHLYQGPIAAISIVPMGLVFTFWYVKTRRLGPVIVAHGLLDLLALMTGPRA